MKILSIRMFGWMCHIYDNYEINKCLLVDYDNAPCFLGVTS